MDEELNKYMKDRMDEAVDNLVGQGVDRLSENTFMIYWRKKPTMQPMLL